MFKRIICTGILVGSLCATVYGLKEAEANKWYNQDNKVKQEEQVKEEKVEYKEPSQEQLKALDEEISERRKAKEQEPSLGEKMSKGMKEYIESPVGTSSPYYVEGGEEGENPVYDGMQEEAFEKPHRKDKYEDSPFYNPETGKNVVEEGEKIQDEMSEEDAPFIR